MTTSANRATSADARSISQSIAEHVVACDFAQLPASAVRAAKTLMLDTLAVAWAGSNTVGTRAAHQLAVEQGGREDSAIWAHRARVPAPWAAFANGVSGAALDYDSFYLGIHSDGIALPAALAVAEREHAHGREMLTALVIANDLICRLGRAAQGSNRGWYFTSMFGIFGAAAATAKLLKLDAAAAANALGLASLQAAGTQQPAVGRTFARR
jgi:2-methylcitrate dehydratase PrpD